VEAIIHQTCQLDCSPSEAYQWFTEDEKLETFFAVEANVEPKLGGKYELSWDPENKPDDSTIGCRITALAAGRMLAFDWKGPVQFAAIMNEADPLTHVVLSFFPLDPERCEIHLVHTGWREGDTWMAARDYFDHAWRSVFDALKEEVNSD
jgi:phenylpropionate dioxygenase-like ring-hydroxylating dioxygenase large terminal subunit